MCKNLLYLSSIVLSLGLVTNSSGLMEINSTAVAKDKPVTLDTDPNLAGWWKFDETSGKTAADSSKHGHKGTLNGGLSFDKNSVSGRTGKALKFDGRDDYIQITRYKGVTGTRPRTVAAWIKTTTPRGEIISWGLDDYGKMWIYGFIGGRERIGVTPSGGYLYINEETDDDQWHHVAAVVVEAELPNLHDDVKLYKDGEPAEIHDIGLLDLWPIDTGSDLDVRIGRRFKGLIDDVRIYGWRCQQNSDYQPVGLHFASLPALSSLSQKRNLISLPVLNRRKIRLHYVFIGDKQWTILKFLGVSLCAIV